MFLNETLHSNALNQFCVTERNMWYNNTWKGGGRLKVRSLRKNMFFFNSENHKENVKLTVKKMAGGLATCEEQNIHFISLFFTCLKIGISMSLLKCAEFV